MACWGDDTYLYLYLYLYIILVRKVARMWAVKRGYHLGDLGIDRIILKRSSERKSDKR